MRTIAPRLIAALEDLFPGSVHIHSVELGNSPDRVIWEYARANGLTILTKDKDFARLPNLERAARR